MSPGICWRPQVLGELRRRGAGQPVGEARRGVEQLDDRVEVAVGRGARGAVGQAGAFPAPGQPGRLPQRPEQPLGARAGGHGVAPGGQHAGHGQHRAAQRVGQGLRADEVGQDGRELAVLAREHAPQLAPQPAQVERVGAADRADQQRLGEVLAEQRRLERAGHRAEQHHHGRLLGQRDVVAADGDGHPGCHHGPAQRTERGGRGPDQDRHLRPRPAVQARRPQYPGEIGGFFARGAEHRDVGAAGRQPVGGVDGALLGPPGQPGGQAPGGGQQLGARAPAAPQRHHRHGATGAEARVDLADRRLVGAAERVDRLVGVAHEHDLVGAVREELQQLGLRRIGVLVLVDEDPAAAGALGGQQLGIVAQDVQRGADELGRVVGAGILHRVHRVVLGQELAGGHPVGAAAGLPERAQAGAVEAALDRAHQQVAQLVGEAGGAQGGTQAGRPSPRVARGQQLAQHDVLLGRRQQPRRGQAAGGVGHAQHAERVGVQGAGDGFADRPIEAGGHAITQVRSCPTAECQHQDLLDRNRPRDDPLDDRLDQCRGLAGARAGQDEQRAARVRDHRVLGRVEHRRGRSRPGRAHQAVGGLAHADHLNTRPRQFRDAGRVPANRGRRVPGRG